jgi:N utilization substance protein B
MNPAQGDNDEQSAALASRSRSARSSGARTVARKLALQALYRWQLNACDWQELVREFAEDPDMRRADAQYFRELISGVCAQRAELDSALEPLLDRKPTELDPIEHAVLLIGGYELQRCPDVPFRVVINEAVALSRRFGATDAYKYINAVLDRASRLWRSQEH